MLEFKKPIPLITPHGNGYAIYVSNSETFDNDVWAVALCETGEIKHYNTSQLKMGKNGTFDIKNIQDGK
jgi:hypothetical protein